jgi:hypothetical protein
MDKHIGGLPWWVWGIGAVVGYYLYRRFAASSANTAQTTAEQNVLANAYGNVTGNPYAASSYAGIPNPAPAGVPAPNPLTGTGPYTPIAAGTTQVPSATPVQVKAAATN